VRAGAAGVHHALGDPLVVEVHDLLAQVEVLQEDRPARPRLERVVAVGDADAVRSGQCVTCLPLGSRPSAGPSYPTPVGLVVAGADWSG
jgi:hypothetical protein